MIYFHDRFQSLPGQFTIYGLAQHVPGAARLLVPNRFTVGDEGERLAVKRPLKDAACAHVPSRSEDAAVQSRGQSRLPENHHVDAADGIVGKTTSCSSCSG